MSFKLVIVCIITILTMIGLSVIPELLLQIKAENNVFSGDEDALFNKGVALDNLGNHTGAILYYDKALAINPNDVSAITNEGNALDD